MDRRRRLLAILLGLLILTVADLWVNRAGFIADWARALDIRMGPSVRLYP